VTAASALVVRRSRLWKRLHATTYEQGLAKRRVSLDELFAPSTMDL